MSTGSFDPAAIVAAFNRRGVAYVVIGSFAAELHAAPVEPTRDIDFRSVSGTGGQLVWRKLRSA